VQAAANKAGDAEKSLRRAIELNPAAPEAWVALVTHLVRSEQKDKALATIEEARKALPAETAPLALAQCKELVGLPQEAEALYKQMLQEQPTAPNVLGLAAGFYQRAGKPAEAETLWRRLIEDPKVEPNQVQRATARRALAVMLMTGGRYQQFREAVALVDKNLEEQNNSVEDRRVKAILLATQPTQRREAIRQFEELSQRQAPSPDERFVLAQLHQADGDWSGFRTAMRDLLGDQPKNPIYLASYISALLARGEPREAASWLQKLEAVEPDSFRTRELKAALLVKQGPEHTQEAVALLNQAAQANPAQVYPAALALERLGQFEPAEALYRRLVTLAQEKQPEVLLVLAGFLHRRQRTNEALDLCDQAWKTCRPEQVGPVCITFLYHSKGDPAQFERVGRRLEEAIAKQPDSVSLQFDLANLRILEKRYDDAEAIYRRLYKQNPTNSGPLNNLAWLLALRGVRLDEALEAIDKAITMEGPNPSLLDTRAIVRIARKETRAAIKDLETAISVRSEPIYSYHLAQAQATEGDRAAASETLQNARKAGFDPATLHPIEFEAYQRLATNLDLTSK
jgi:tetratricopeptide (TPR) repeat protein